MLKELNTEECMFLFIINQVLTLHLHLHSSITIYPQVIYVFSYLITSNLRFYLLWKMLILTRALYFCILNK